GLEARGVDDGEFRRVRTRRVFIDDEQVAREETVPGELRDDADREAELRVGAGKAVLDEQFLAFERAEQFAVQKVELRRLHRPVHLAPGDVMFARRVADDEFVVRRAAGMLTCAAGERSFGGDHRLAPLHGLFVERGRRQVPVNGTALDPLAVEPACPLNCAHRLLLKYVGPATYMESGIVLGRIWRVNSRTAIR